MSCLLSPVVYAHQLLGLGEFRLPEPLVGSLGVAEVRGDTSTLLRNPRLTAMVGGVKWHTHHWTPSRS
jgi:hypothetical protein